MAMPALNGSAMANLLLKNFSPWVISLNTTPRPRPQKTLEACLPPLSAATSTSAHAIPSGYGSLPCSRLIR